LVHEVFLRLSGSKASEPALWNSKGHFFAAAAEAMRRILVERARRHRNKARREPITLSELTGDPEAPAFDIDLLDAALDALHTESERRYNVVMLRFFAGVGVQQTAELLEVSEMTVLRDWTFARAWLIDHMEANGSG
jgi:RNA polymerase sigma factor (TIGR02999 family)